MYKQDINNQLHPDMVPSRKIQQMNITKCKKHKENNNQKQEMGQEIQTSKMTRKGQLTT